MSTDAMKQALEQTLEMLSDNREYIEANERPDYLAMYDKAIAGAGKALAEQSGRQEPFAFTDSYGNLWTKSAAQQLIDKSILLPLYVGKPEH